MGHATTKVKNIITLQCGENGNKNLFLETKPLGFRIRDATIYFQNLFSLMIIAVLFTKKRGN